MTGNTQDQKGMPTAEFETALRTLLLDSFAEGAAVQGTWEFTSQSSVVPNWQVTIEKTDNADPPEDGTTFIDE